MRFYVIKKKPHLGQEMIQISNFTSFQHRGTNQQQLQLFLLELLLLDHVDTPVVNVSFVDHIMKRSWCIWNQPKQS